MGILFISINNHVNLLHQYVTENFNIQHQHIPSGTILILDLPKKFHC